MQEVSFHYEGKSFIVVGASSGIGRHITKDLAKAGANVLAIARDFTRLEDVKRLYPDNITTGILDVLQAGDEEWNEIILPFVKKNGKLYGGVYTAGISRMSSLRMFDEHDARAVMETSFWGMIQFIRNISRKKYASSGSSFVVFSSAASYIGQKGGIAYAAGKAAVSNAVKSIASEIAPNKQRINSISPGWVKTNMTYQAERDSGGIVTDNLESCYPLGLGEPKDVSGMVLFLLSDAAGWITGTDVVIDGGFLIGRN